MRYTSWKCDGGINPYISDIPTGTKCTTTCPAWRETLESRCVAGNQWTKTIGTKPSTGVQPPSVESSAAFRALPYATTIYNTPDMEDMVCGCQDLGPFDYNPNNFTEAKLVCTGRERKNFDAPWSLTTTDRCDLFCNDGGSLLKLTCSLKTSLLQCQLDLSFVMAPDGLVSQRKGSGAMKNLNTRNPPVFSSRNVPQGSRRQAIVKLQAIHPFLLFPIG